MFKGETGENWCNSEHYGKDTSHSELRRFRNSRWFQPGSHAYDSADTTL